MAHMCLWILKFELQRRGCQRKNKVKSECRRRQSGRVEGWEERKRKKEEWDG